MVVPSFVNIAQSYTTSENKRKAPGLGDKMKYRKSTNIRSAELISDTGPSGYSHPSCESTRFSEIIAEVDIIGEDRPSVYRSARLVGL